MEFKYALQPKTCELKCSVLWLPHAAGPRFPVAVAWALSGSVKARLTLGTASMAGPCCALSANGLRHGRHRSNSLPRQISWRRHVGGGEVWGRIRGWGRHQPSVAPANARSSPPMIRGQAFLPSTYTSRMAGSQLDGKYFCLSPDEGLLTPAPLGSAQKRGGNRMGKDGAMRPEPHTAGATGLPHFEFFPCTFRITNPG